MEGSDDGAGPAGLRFLLQFDPGNPGLDHRTLLGFSLSALFSRLLRWSKDGQRRGAGGGFTAIAAEGGEEDSGNTAVSAAALAAAASLCLAAMYASGQRPRRRRLPAAPALPAPSSAPRTRALPAPRDGLRILSSNPDDESTDTVIHGASIGAGDEEPDIVARVEMDAMPAAQVVAVANAETEPDHPEEEEEERQELRRLRELWLSLLEREQRLELRLRELEGLRSQEADTVRELESRVAAADAGTRLLQLRVSALQEDNGRLRAQVEELDTARAELARAKEKLRAVKARVQGEQEEARHEVEALRAKVAELESGGEERAAALAAEVAELRKANAALEEDSMELALRLQDAEQAGASASVNLVPNEEGMVEEMTYLRESNERLTRQIEQLRNDHCAHVEELVYLKWVNACLRHELLRDHDGGHLTAEQKGHNADNRLVGSRGDLSSALELSKSMSFRSSERAKQLMLRYGHPGLDGFDPTLFSPLHESVDGDGYERSPASNYEHQRSPYARSETGTAMAASVPAAASGKKAGARKLKLLGNIKKLLPGGKRNHGHGHGHGHDHDHAGRDAGRKAPAPRDEYLQKAMQWLSTHDVLDVDHSYESTPLSSCDRTPLSSVTTNTTVNSRARGGDDGQTTRPEAEPVLARSKSDAGGSYGREGSRYHTLRPDHPASEADKPDRFRRAPEKREARRRSEELRSPAVA